MTSHLNLDPDIDVQPAEYVRLLGYPPGTELEGRALELAEGARAWLRAYAQPWVYTREIDRLELDGDSFVIDGVPFSCARQASTLRDARAHSVILAAASAGAALEAQAQRLWREEKPDEYFFLEVLGSALVEHLVTMTGARLCAWADDRGMAVLPHYSPGYPDWDIADQPRLLHLMTSSPDQPMNLALEVFDTGMLRPKKSLLAVFGVTRHVDRVQRHAGLAPCANCSFLPCQYRRSPYRRTAVRASPELPGRGPDASTGPTRTPLTLGAKYSVNTRALERWSQNRVALLPRDNGELEVRFAYEGTTCTNTGRPLHFRYTVVLGPRVDGYPIRSQHCHPAGDDDGHTHMCRFQTHREAFIASIDEDQPLRDRPLDDVLSWERPASLAGCYCDRDSRLHKWGLVLETIHYALARLETA